MTSNRRKRLWWRLRSWWWRRVQGRISRWLDRRYQTRHLREYGWPITMGSGPFSYPESRWHGCPEGHVWERLDWPYGRHTRRGHRPDRVTRCRVCGAPRCTAYHGEAFPDWPLDDHAEQFFRCVRERHHDDSHDFLTGVQIPVGG